MSENFASQRNSEMEAIKEANKKNIESAFSLLVDLLVWDGNLKHCGYSSKEDAAIKIVTRTYKENNKRIAAWEKKYPD